MTRPHPGALTPDELEEIAREMDRVVAASVDRVLDAGNRMLAEQLGLTADIIGPNGEKVKL